METVNRILTWDVVTKVGAGHGLVETSKIVLLK
jgi:hypothetical protein